jgi:hypothetical protein
MMFLGFLGAPDLLPVCLMEVSNVPPPMHGPVRGPMPVLCGPDYVRPIGNPTLLSWMDYFEVFPEATDKVR